MISKKCLKSSSYWVISTPPKLCRQTHQSTYRHKAEDTRDTGSTSGSGRSPGEENGNRFQCFYLGNPMDRGVWWATVHWVARSRTQLSTHPSPLLFSCKERGRKTGDEDETQWTSSLSWGPFSLGRNQFHAWSILLIAHPFHTENLLATWGINIHLHQVFISHGFMNLLVGKQFSNSRPA